MLFVPELIFITKPALLVFPVLLFVLRLLRLRFAKRFLTVVYVGLYALFLTLLIVFGGAYSDCLFFLLLSALASLLLDKRVKRRTPRKPEKQTAKRREDAAV